MKTRSLFDIRHDKSLPLHIREAANCVYKFSEKDNPGDIEALIEALRHRLDYRLPDGSVRTEYSPPPRP